MMIKKTNPLARPRLVVAPMPGNEDDPEHAKRRISKSGKPWRLASIGGDNPDFDVIDELANNRHDYSGDEWMTVRSFPGSIATSLDRIRNRVPGRKPGIHPTATCCSTHGISLIQSNSSITGLLELKDSFDSVEGIKADLVDSVSTWFRYFPVNSLDTRMSGSKNQNIYIPKGLKAEIDELAGEIGIYSSSLFMLSVAATLSTQLPVLKEHKVMFTDYVTTLFDLAEIRKKVGGLMLSSLKELQG